MSSEPVKELPVKVYGEKLEEISHEGNLKGIFKDFKAAHSLGFLFASRNIKAKYRQSLFGVFWALFPPIATALIWILLNKTSVIKMETPGVPYPLFVMMGTMLWTVFSSAVVTPIQSMQANKSILVKVNFPREAIIISAFYEVLFNALLSLIVIIGALLFYEVPFGMNFLVIFPGIFVLLVLGISIGLFLLPVSMLFKDIQFGLPAILQFLMYLTPVVYALPAQQGTSKLFYLNPVTPVLTNTRSWVLGIEAAFSASPFIIVSSVALLMLLLGLILQRITIEILIERMGS